MAALTGPGHPVSGRARWVALAVVALIVNLPVVQGWWADRQLAADGVEVRAEVVEAAVVGDGEDARPVLAFRLPRRFDERQSSWAVEVERATFVDAEQTRVVDVRVLPGRPSVFEVDGEVRTRLGLWMTLVVDAFLLAVVAYTWRRRRAAGGAGTGPGTGSGPERGAGSAVGAHDGARVVATGDLVPRGPGAAYEPHPDGSVEVRGALVGIRDDEVVLDLGSGARVTVVLEGHRLGVGFGEAAQVRGLPLG